MHLILNSFLNVRCDKLTQVVSSLIFAGGYEISISYISWLYEARFDKGMWVL